MSYSPSNGLVLSILLFFCIACTNEKEASNPSINTSVEPFIASKEVNLLDKQVINHHQLTAWQRDSPSIILIDTRPDSSFQKGHLKGAVSLWRPEIESKRFPYKGMMLEKPKLELILGKLGATSKSIFVVYDNSGNADAARLWWILSTYGHSKTYLLNGGLQSSPKGLISQTKTAVKPAKFSFAEAERLDLRANKKAIFAALTDSNTVLLDCRTLDEFTGKITKKNAFRAGRIPSAIHINYTNSIAYHQAHQFKSSQELSLIFQAIPKDKSIIIYCQSGVRSAHTTFVLRQLLDFPNVANYDGSWIEWSHDKSLPILTGL